MDVNEFLWIEDGDVLFKHGTVFGTYSYYGWQDSLGLAFYGYIEGYKNGADELIDIALEAGKKGRIDVLDTFIYPIIFLYRQVMELCLKNIYLKYAEVSPEEKIKYINKVGHDLKKSWVYVKPIIIKYSATDEDKKSVDIAEQYVNQMNDFDPTSFGFRYPTDKKVELNHKNWVYIDLPNLKQKMDKFYNYYNGVDLQISSKINL
ncbi:hypothetical protein [Alkaliphilus transvaalensis]|uniref:hypothetical protein n=1 Tax=Alkaliphilus transvaalensis TaxID=114628 RepID=UPI00047D740B|nr:hypothetical protein [Alkaliphilus transvaalensis]